MDQGDVLLEADGLRRSFGGRVAVEDVRFRGCAGEILGLLGPNGAGKTTTLRMLAGLLAPTGGRVLLAGRDLATEPPAARARLAYLPEQAPLYEEMTVEGYVRFLARLRGASRASARAAAEHSIGQVGVADAAGRVIATLSRGYRQRVAIAGALVHDPAVLLLDEPTTALDPRQIVDVRRLIASLARDRLVVLSTHQLAEAEQLCDRALVLHRGRQAALGPLAELRRHAGAGRVRLVVRGGRDAVAACVRKVDGVRVVEVGVTGGEVTVVVEAEPAVRPAVAAAVVGAGLELLELADVGSHLEDAFLALTA